MNISSPSAFSSRRARGGLSCLPEIFHLVQMHTSTPSTTQSHLDRFAMDTIVRVIRSMPCDFGFGRTANGPLKRRHDCLMVCQMRYDELLPFRIDLQTPNNLLYCGAKLGRYAANHKSRPQRASKRASQSVCVVFAKQRVRINEPFSKWSRWCGSSNSTKPLPPSGLAPAASITGCTDLRARCFPFPCPT